MASAPRAWRAPQRMLLMVSSVLVLAGAAAAIVHEPSSDAVRRGGYLATDDGLSERAERAAAGRQPWRAAREGLEHYAEGALAREPSPSDPLDLPRTTGPFVDDTTRAYALALAYSISGDERYARKARGFVLAWVGTAGSTRNACPDSGSCTTSLVVSRVAPGFVFAADLLEGSDVWSTQDGQRLRSWLRRVILPAASERRNNWGDAGTFMRIVVTDYLGDDEAFAAAVQAWRDAMDLVASDGHLPEETRRQGGGLQYTQEALTYRLAVAVIAERRGIDLWGHKGAQGATLKDAVDYLARFWSEPEAWPWHDDVKVPTPGPMWELAFAHWRDCDYAPIVDAGRPFGEKSNSAVRWTTLTSSFRLADCPR